MSNHGTRLPRAPLTFLLLAGAVSACPPGGGDPAMKLCESDSDCTGPAEVCVFDIGPQPFGDAALIVQRSYCARRCTVDGDCPSSQSCRTGVDRPESGSTETKLCIDKARACGPVDLCNGLDDDCDGVVDGEACQPIVDCLDDEPCGTFICRAPENQPSALCLPENEQASLPDFSVCTADAQCRTGLCETGTCSPLCRARSPECPEDSVCVRAVGASARPPHNACQELCKTTRSCTAPTECVFRDVYRGPDADPATSPVAFVCSLLAPTLKDLGEPCTGHSPAGNAECKHGLCFGGVCTRPCEIGDRCQDMGPTFECRTETIGFGTNEVPAEVCEVPR